MDNKTYVAFVDSIAQKNYTEATQRFAQLGMLVNASVSLAGESGELLDAIKKHIMYGKPIDTENVKEELGDILYYIAMAANAMGWTLEDIMQANYDKLKKRYPNGHFTEADAIARKDKRSN
ncbi:MAG: nucleoside triphosphate pyrophosphohydrolase family protein [Candidatus Bilamarchaeaceae archaeon]